MKINLSSIRKRISPEDTLGLFGILVVVSTLFIVYLAVTIFQTQVSDFVAFQQTTSAIR